MTAFTRNKKHCPEGFQQLVTQTRNLLHLRLRNVVGLRPSRHGTRVSRGSVHYAWCRFLNPGYRLVLPCKLLRGPCDRCQLYPYTISQAYALSVCPRLPDSPVLCPRARRCQRHIIQRAGGQRFVQLVQPGVRPEWLHESVLHQICSSVPNFAHSITLTPVNARTQKSCQALNHIRLTRLLPRASLQRQLPHHAHSLVLHGLRAVGCGHYTWTDVKRPLSAKRVSGRIN